MFGAGVAQVEVVALSDPAVWGVDLVQGCPRDRKSRLGLIWMGSSGDLKGSVIADLPGV